MSDKEFWSLFPRREKRTKQELREKNRRVTIKRRENGKQQAYNAALKAEILTYYGGGTLACVGCGFDDLQALTLDHTDSDGAKEKKKGKQLYFALKKADYPNGYQTLCMNCQWIKRATKREYGDGGRSE